jgi:hypothetical protein
MPPSDYGESLYKENADLGKLAANQLFGHWPNHGLEEGRRASMVRDRQSLLTMLFLPLNIFPVMVTIKSSANKMSLSLATALNISQIFSLIFFPSRRS